MELSTMISSTLRLGVPLLLAALGVLTTAKSGIINMGMEGNMLLGAFVAAYATDISSNSIVGLLAGAFAGMIYSLLMGALIIKGRGHHVVVGLGLNFVVTGLTIVLLNVIWGTSGFSTPIKRLPQVDLPWLGQQSISLFIAIACVVFVTLFLDRMNAGRRIKMIGENPAAADSVGIDVIKYQFLAVAIAGILGGLGGAELSIGQMGYFVKRMTASKGFLAYSAVVFAGYDPKAVVLTTMLLGFLDALQMRAQTMLNIPGQFFLMLPYLFTLIALIGVGGKRRPKAAGQTYIRGYY